MHWGWGIVPVFWQQGYVLGGGGEKTHRLKSLYLSCVNTETAVLSSSSPTKPNGSASQGAIFRIIYNGSRMQSCYHSIIIPKNNLIAWFLLWGYNKKMWIELSSRTVLSTMERNKKGIALRQWLRAASCANSTDVICPRLIGVCGDGNNGTAQM